jgi:DNA-binding MarR family transcriptional regulator
VNSRPARRESVLPRFDCACATLRRTARLVTQLYDEELRPHIEVPQFALLSVLEQSPACPQSRLAKSAGIDKTTISRNLALMRRKGWIEDAHSDDPRDRPVRITAAGRNVLRAARPGWNRAQKRLSSTMKPGEWEKMWTVLDELTNAAVRAREIKAAQ